MSLLYSAHQILKLASSNAHRLFFGQADQLKQVQLNRLRKVLNQPQLSYTSFAQNTPVTRYADWKADIEASRNTGLNTLNSSEIIRFQPTSGSSEALKFIPYTQLFLDELDQAIGLWLTNLYLQYPRLKKGTHYWSVSWLPESQRHLTSNQNLNDDSALLSLSKRILMQITQAVPSDIALAENADDAMFATAVYLVRDAKLTLISVWSPTFALQLFEIIEKNCQEISAVLRSGQWTRQGLHFLKISKSVKRAQLIDDLDFSHPNCWKTLWPNLELISSWDTASAAYWATLLKQKVAGVNFQGKGLWATEGVVTLPIDSHFPLAYQSHFYEFLDLDSQMIHPAWDLKIGQNVSPIITTGSGLQRYIIDDELNVTEFYHGIPCFEFLGRKMTVDLVGEKIDQSTALSILEKFKNDDYLPISLLGIELGKNAKSHYVLLSEGQLLSAPTSEQVDDILKQNFHYELARNLGQLDCPEILNVDDAWQTYKNIAMRNGMIEGNIKPEPLKKMKTL